MSKETGGAAFPSGDTRNAQALALGKHSNASSGMTLRDYFAAKAMQVYLAARIDGDDADIALDAYCVADAMLVERDQ